MTIEEFNNTKFHCGMKAVGHSFNLKSLNGVKTEGEVVSACFDQCLIAIADNHGAEIEEWAWFRCENVELIKKDEL